MAFGRLASLFVDIVVQTTKYQTQLNNMQNQTKQAANNMQASFMKIGLGAGGIFLIKKALTEVTSTVLLSTQKFAALEKQIVDIQKVAKFGEFQEFARGYIQLGTEMRGVSFKELGEIGGDLARLGVRGGAKEFLEFLKVSAQFAQSTGDLDLRQAGEGIGKLLQNFGKELNSVNALAASSSINKLADDFAVTSNEILTVTQKLSGFADAVGLSQEQTLGLVTLIKQTGISSTVVESSLTRLFTVMESEPRKVAEAIGLSGNAIEEFVVKLKSEPIEAVRAFFQALNAMPVDRAVGILKELELATSRNAVALLNATNRFDDWNKTQQAAIDGSRDAASLLDKYALSAETAASKIEQLTNRWNVFLASLGNTQALDFLNGLLANLTPGQLNVVPSASGPKDTRTTLQKLEEVDKLWKDAKNRKLESDKGTGFTLDPTAPVKWLIEQGKLTGEIENLKNKRSILIDQLHKELELKEKSTQEDEKQAFLIREKAKDAMIASRKEAAGNMRLFGERGLDFLQEENRIKSMREGFEHRLKEEKKFFTGAGSAEIHAQLEIETQRKIAEKTIEIKKEEADEKARIEQRRLDKLQQAADEAAKKEQDRIASIRSFGLSLGITGQTGDTINNLLRFRELGITDKGMKKSFLDMILNPRQAPEIKSLDSVYRDAITKQEDVDERAADLLESILKELETSKELTREQTDAIRANKPKAPVG